VAAIVARIGPTATTDAKNAKPRRTAKADGPRKHKNTKGLATKAFVVLSFVLLCFRGQTAVLRGLRVLRVKSAVTFSIQDFCSDCWRVCASRYAGVTPEGACHASTSGSDFDGACGLLCGWRRRRRRQCRHSSRASRSCDSGRQSQCACGRVVGGAYQPPALAGAYQLPERAGDRAAHLLRADAGQRRAPGLREQLQHHGRGNRARCQRAVAGANQPVHRRCHDQRRPGRDEHSPDHVDPPAERGADL
jgi:hypothetical protein